MFNDRYGLTGAVLRGDKTMTRRMMTMTLHRCNKYGQMVKIVPDDMFIASDGTAHFQVGRNGYMVPKQNQPAYKVGEEIAIAQPYKQCWDIYQKQWESYNDSSSWRTPDAILGDSVQETAGWTNKMFVKAEYMPHAIRIKSIKAERLQSISEADIMREGIHEGEFMNTWDKYYFDEWGDVPNHITFKTPRLAFQSLIDKVCKRGTWKRNPWVYAYEFELVR